MRLGPFHLTYCSNIHAGERWDDVQRALEDYLPRIRQKLGVRGPFGVGLRLSAQAASTLSQPAAMERFRAFLRAGDYYVFTINGFPYGSFHGTRVKEDVYLPDWRDERRLRYTNECAGILAALLPDDVALGSVSTVPGAFRPTLTGSSAGEMARMIRRHAEHLAELEARTGKHVMLALEPEPACFLEKTEDAIWFFEEWLKGDVRRYVGLCYDACHMAVQFEDHARSLDALANAGITIAKVQVTSALHLDSAADAGGLEQLAAFADDTYLHQVVRRSGGSILDRFEDLPEALAAAACQGCEWRVHFHLPVHRGGAGGLATTQDDLRKLLVLLKERHACHYLEVETYTWDVLLPSYKAEDLTSDIAAELAWTRSVLAS